MSKVLPIRPCDIAAKKQITFPDFVLDIEEVYSAWWDVAYDKPAYCETYEPSWIFTPKKKE